MSTLRELLRHMQALRSLYEAEGIDEIPLPGGESITLWDLEYLLEEIHTRLPPRQREAIDLCLVQGMREVDAAVTMGVSATNPVAMYATAGLRKILVLVEAGQLPRFKPLGLGPIEEVAS